MKVEQTGMDKIKITLDSDLEKATIGKAVQIELTIEQTATVGFRTTPEAARSMLLEMSDAK